MIPTWFLIVVTIGVAVMAIALLVQLGLLLGIYFTVRGLQQKMESLLDRQIQPILQTAKSIVDQADMQVQRVAGTIEELSDSIRSQVARVDEVVTEATDRARLQLIRVDEVVNDALTRFDETTSYIQNGVIRPVQELQAVVRGISRALNVLLGKGRRGPQGITQDEELFI